MHFLVHVILASDCREPISESAVEKAVERLLTPHAGGDGGSPDGWFDWYEIGGRFAGAVKPSRPLQSPAPSGLWSRLVRPKAAPDTAYGRDVLGSWSSEDAPFVVVTPDGVAHGTEDWSKDPFAPWEERFKLLLEKHADHLVVGVDAHI